MLEAMLDPVSRAIANALLDDEPVNEEEARALAASREWLKHNPGIRHEEVLADFGLTRRLEEEPEKPRVRKIAWSESARADIRRLDRDTAMRIFVALHRFAETGEGDLKKSRDSPASCAFASAIAVCASPMNRMTLYTFTPGAIAAKPYR